MLFSVRLLPCVLLSACISSTGDDGADLPLPPDGPLAVELATDHPSYPLGGSALVRITNGTDAVIGWGACEDELERWLGERWVQVARVHYPCPLIELSLNPGASQTLPFDLRAAGVPGTYRLRRPFWALGGETGPKSYRRSNSFLLTSFQ
ncbi:MAG TPA: hypothetical protein VL241_06005 [Gemmatimonadales bacterium]|nr:hypothetical protein [Gemmatimonadales bacterium]